MNYQALFKGDYIKAVEFNGKQPTLTITDVQLEKLASLKAGDLEPDGEAKKKDKGVIYFREVDRGWVLNRTNAECMAALFGPETEQWKGRRVTLFATMVQLGRKRELGIRVKGSPELKEPLEVTIHLPRKKPIKMTLEPTGTSRQANGVNGHATTRDQQPQPPANDAAPPDGPPPDGPPADDGYPEPGAEG